MTDPAQTAPEPPAPGLSRRTVFRGAAAGGVGVAGAALLAACGGGGSSGGGGADASSAASSGAPKTGTTLTPTAEVPVGGGTILKSANVVVTQPTQGTFKAFSATCTHAGCQVAEISGSDIDCACHGSKFSIKDGSVVNGPADKALPEVSIRVDGANVVTT